MSSAPDVRLFGFSLGTGGSGLSLGGEGGGARVFDREGGGWGAGRRAVGVLGDDGTTGLGSD